LYCVFGYIVLLLTNCFAHPLQFLSPSTPTRALSLTRGESQCLSAFFPAFALGRESHQRALAMAFGAAVRRVTSASGAEAMAVVPVDELGAYIIELCDTGRLIDAGGERDGGVAADDDAAAGAPAADDAASAVADSEGCTPHAIIARSLLLELLVDVDGPFAKQFCKLAATLRVSGECTPAAAARVLLLCDDAVHLVEGERTQATQIQVRALSYLSSWQSGHLFV